MLSNNTLAAHPTTKTKEPVVTRRERVESVDLLRGVVMILMALDHVRDFFGGTGVSPTNLATTTAPLFFTRWITHLCAPVFFLLSVLFYFVAHLAAIHGLAVLICWLRYGAVHWMFESPDLSHFPVTEPTGWPLGLPVVYLIWISIVVALYPLCRWYAAVKARSGSRWLSYL